MKKISIILSLSAVSIIIFNKCLNEINSCDQVKVTNYGNFYLSATDKKIIPYTGHPSILIFKDSLGDTLKYTSKGTVSTTQQYMGKDIETAGPDCPTAMDYVENINIYFSEKGYNDGINVAITPGEPVYNNQNYIGFQIDYYENSTDWFLNNGCNFNNLQLETANSQQLTVTYKDSLTFSNKKFYSVYILQQPGGYEGGVWDLQYVFYTVAQGVIGFRTKPHGTTWYLLNEQI